MPPLTAARLLRSPSPPLPFGQRLHRSRRLPAQLPPHPHHAPMARLQRPPRTLPPASGHRPPPHPHPIWIFTCTPVITTTAPRPFASASPPALHGHDVAIERAHVDWAIKRTRNLQNQHQPLKQVFSKPARGVSGERPSRVWPPQWPGGSRHASPCPVLAPPITVGAIKPQRQETNG